jgi:flavin reductase (DIM6/NTAB) family NADH-FMN oxidoreductase RutF
VTSPNPTWKPGDKISSPVSEMIALDPTTLPVQSVYKLMIGSIVPRPIAFVSTINNEGQGNLAPFSYFIGISSNPMCLAISVTAQPDGQPKDTLRNILDTKEFVVNTVSSWFVEAMAYTSANYPYGVDEMEKVGLTPLASTIVKPKRVKESPVHFECKLFKSLAIGDGSPGSSNLLVGQVVMVHIHKNAYNEGKIILDELKPVARLSGQSYALLGDIFDVAVPKPAK